jgi:hypothetical protein
MKKKNCEEIRQKRPGGVPRTPDFEMHKGVAA